MDVVLFFFVNLYQQGIHWEQTVLTPMQVFAKCRNHSHVLCFWVSFGS